MTNRCWMHLRHENPRYHYSLRIGPAFFHDTYTLCSRLAVSYILHELAWSFFGRASTTASWKFSSSFGWIMRKALHIPGCWIYHYYRLLLSLSWLPYRASIVMHSNPGERGWHGWCTRALYLGTYSYHWQVAARRYYYDTTIAYCLFLIVIEARCSSFGEILMIPCSG